MLIFKVASKSCKAIQHGMKGSIVRCRDASSVINRVELDTTGNVGKEREKERKRQTKVIKWGDSD